MDFYSKQFKTDKITLKCVTDLKMFKASTLVKRSEAPAIFSLRVQSTLAHQILKIQHIRVHV